jgi:hypothetical protein
MPFGKYKDYDISEIPHSYLTWCLENLERLGPDLRWVMEQTLAGEDPADPEQMQAEIERLRRQVRRLQKRIRELEATTGSQAPARGDRLAESFNAWYRRAALAAHPDRGGSEAMMKLVNELRDHIKKECVP